MPAIEVTETGTTTMPTPRPRATVDLGAVAQWVLSGDTRDAERILRAHGRASWAAAVAQMRAHGRERQPL